MKNLLSLLLALFLLSACAEMQQVVNTMQQSPSTSPNNTSAGNNTVSTFDASNGLKEALLLGVNKGVSELSSQGGYMNNELLRILLPEELRKVDQTLRSIGLGSLCDQGLKLINSAAEDAVKEASPIFTNAITNMSFTDVMQVVTGGKGAATNYLSSATREALTAKFKPSIASSLDRVGANKIWAEIIGKYNKMPFIQQQVTPDLSDYVTQQAISGLFSKIQEKEDAIRGNVNERSSDLLKRVFELQD